MLYDNDTFTVQGRTFIFKTEYDDTSDPPWEAADGHGPVSDWTTRAKKPGEWVLASDGDSKRFYDAQEALALAKKDWVVDGTTEEGTRAQRAAKAVTADFEYLRRWCNDEWQYIGVIVQQCDDDGERFGPVRSLWGIESDSGDYLEQVARELAEDLISDTDSAQRDLAATLGVTRPLERERAGA